MLTDSPLPDVEVDQYGLPGWVGAWVGPRWAGRPVRLRAAIDGRTIGEADVADEAGSDGRRRAVLRFEAVDPGVIDAGRLRVFARVEGDGERPVTCWEVLRAVDAMAGAMATLTRCRSLVGGDVAAAVADFPRMFPGRIAPLFPSSRPRLTPRDPGHPEEVAREGTSLVHLPVGLASRDGEAVLGRGGFAFLLRGSNSLIDQYRADPGGPDTLRQRDRWISLLEVRARGAAERGVRFVQLIVPEKSSLLFDLMPPAFGLTGPTPLLAGIETGLPRSTYLSTLDVLRSSADRAGCFRRMDTHLAPQGAFALAAALLRHLGLEAPAPPSFDFTVAVDADLADRFFDVPLIDPVLEAHLAPTAQLVEQHVPALDKHQGRRQVWRHPAAPIRRRVLVFGNSVCNFADYGQSYLSFWFAHLFSEYHFVWSPDCDWAVVEAVRPDIVICQTVERFLPLPPRD